jgi:hypothetical protein
MLFEHPPFLFAATELGNCSASEMTVMTLNPKHVVVKNLKLILTCFSSILTLVQNDRI